MTVMSDDMDAERRRREREMRAYWRDENEE
jgi:hypothetical protein